MQQGLIKHDFYLFEGINAYAEDNRIPENTLYYAENARFKGKRLSSKLGRQSYGVELTGGTYIKGLNNYEEFPGGVKKESLVAYYDSQFSKMNIDTLAVDTIVPTGWTAGDVDVESVSYNGTLYVANGEDLIGSIYDTTFAVIDDSPPAWVLETWGEKMWGIDNVVPATLQYTRTASALNPEYIEQWTGDGTGAELIGYGGALTSLRRLNTKMYAFKQDWIEEFYGFDTSGTYPVPQRQAISKAVGAINHRSTVIVENDIWFLTPSLEIRSLGAEAGYIASDSRVEDMSAIIWRYKSDLDPDQSQATGEYFGELVRFCLKEKGSSQPNLVLVYDIETGGWSLDKGVSVVDYCKTGSKLFSCSGGTSGQIYQEDVGYSNAGYAYDWNAVTGLVDDGAPDLMKHARYVYVRGARSADVAINVYLLGEDRERLETHVIPAPTAAEIAAGTSGTVTPEDAWRGVGDDQVGGEGYYGTEEGAPPVYRFNVVFSCSSNARMYGIEFESSLNDQRAFIDEAKLKYIPRRESYYPITS